MSEPKRYHHFIKFYSKSFTDVTGARYCYPDAGMIEDKDGKYVEYEDYARLKSLCDNLGMGGKHTITAIDAENARLKAEVERLTAIVGADAIDREHGMCCDASAQVERLTKAGDAMAKLLSCCGNPQSEVRGWHAAKGVQS